MTQGAERLMNELGLDAVHYLVRHVTGDWGNVDEQDKEANETAVYQGGRIISAYGEGQSRILIVTEWDRSVTTILQPDEY